MNRAEADRDAVPGIDRSNAQCQIDHFRFGEMLTHLVVDGVGNMCLRDQCHRLGPGKGSALALAVERRFMPRVKQIEALLGLAASACFARMQWMQ